MKRIGVRQRDKWRVALVDDNDFDRVSSFNWFMSNGYACTWIGGDVKMHRLILGLEYGDGLQVDHKNRKPLDNRRANLRIVTHKEQMRNRGMRLGESGVRGVLWHRASGRWRVERRIDGRKVHFGYFDLFDDAVEVANHVWQTT